MPPWRCIPVQKTRAPQSNLCDALSRHKRTNLRFCGGEEITKRTRRGANESLASWRQANCLKRRHSYAHNWPRNFVASKFKSEKNPKSEDSFTKTRQFLYKFARLSASQKCLRHHVNLAWGPPRQSFGRFNTDPRRPAYQRRPARTSLRLWRRSCKIRECPYNKNYPQEAFYSALWFIRIFFPYPFRNSYSASVLNEEPLVTPVYTERGNLRSLVPLYANNRPARRLFISSARHPCRFLLEIQG